MNVISVYINELFSFLFRADAKVTELLCLSVLIIRLAFGPCCCVVDRWRQLSLELVPQKVTVQCQGDGGLQSRANMIRLWNRVIFLCTVIDLTSWHVSSCLNQGWRQLFWDETGNSRFALLCAWKSNLSFEQIRRATVAHTWRGSRSTRGQLNSSKPSWPLNMGPIGIHETSVSNYLTPRNNPGVQFNRGASLRSPNRGHNRKWNCLWTVVELSAWW